MNIIIAVTIITVPYRSYIEIKFTLRTKVKSYQKGKRGFLYVLHMCGFQ